MRLIYLAGPYAHDKELVRKHRREYYSNCIRYFMEKADNLFLFSPILHQAELAPHSFDYWAQRDFFMIKKSSAMWVLTIPGWNESYGVAQELEYADSIQREVLYVVQENSDYVLTDARPVYTPTPIN